MGQLMRAEPEEMTVRRLSQRPRGGSGNNPFLKANRSVMEYNVLIEPQQIAKKIMQVTGGHTFNFFTLKAGSTPTQSDGVTLVWLFFFFSSSSGGWGKIKL